MPHDRMHKIPVGTNEWEIVSSVWAPARAWVALAEADIRLRCGFLVGKVPGPDKASG